MAATNRISKSSVDWLKFSTKIPRNDEAKFKLFKSKSDAYLRQVASLPESLPQIHWDQYSKIPVAGLVEKFRKQYDGLQIAYPGVKDYIKNINEKEKEAMVMAEKFIVESNVRIESHKVMITKFENMIPISEMTYEDYYEHFPEKAIDVDNPKSIPPHTEEFTVEALKEDERKLFEERKKPTF